MFEEEQIEALNDLVDAEKHQKREAVIAVAQKLIETAIDEDSVIFEGILQPEMYQHWADTQLWISLRHFEFAVNLLTDAGIIEIDQDNIIIRKPPNESDIEEALKNSSKPVHGKKHFSLYDHD